MSAKSTEKIATSERPENLQNSSMTRSATTGARMIQKLSATWPEMNVAGTALSRVSELFSPGSRSSWTPEDTARLLGRSARARKAIATVYSGRSSVVERNAD
jgi:hypothetical protein